MFSGRSLVWSRTSACHAPINYKVLRNGFIDFLNSREFCDRYKKDLVSALEKYHVIIKEPMDIIQLFSKVDSGRKTLWLALRNMFNYLELLGFNPLYLTLLRKALPKLKCGVDLRIPTEKEIRSSLVKMGNAPLKYGTLWNLLLDSGIRLSEAIRFLKAPSRIEEIGGFYRSDLGYFRGYKQAFYVHFTEFTYELLQKLDDAPDLVDANASHYFCKYDFVSPKYIRKFMFDKMIELEIPESIADFIQGRSVRRIGARHYMIVERQASKYYRRYMEYLKKLRSD